MLFCPHELLQCELLSYFSFEKLPGKHSFSVLFLCIFWCTCTRLFFTSWYFFIIFFVSWVHNEYAMFDLSGRFVCFNGPRPQCPPLVLNRPCLTQPPFLQYWDLIICRTKKSVGHLHLKGWRNQARPSHQNCPNWADFGSLAMPGYVSPSNVDASRTFWL